MLEHKKQWEFLKRKFESGQLAHAYLFCGQANLGKKRFAKNFAEFIGCKFPDLMTVEGAGDLPAQAGISISKIREVQNFLSYKSYNGGYKVVIVDNAEKMNAEAQNCFLKTLEEPKGETLLMLISSKPELLLPTIFSRCQTLKFFGRPEASKEKKEEENKILQGVVAVIGKDLSEKFKYAKSLDFEKQSFSQILEVMQKYYRELLLEGSLEAKRILKIIDEINYKASFTNINQKLALEALLIQL